MTTLIPVDGSQGAHDAVRYAVAHDPNDEVVLVHVAPSAREGDLARGRFVLTEAEREARAVRQDAQLRCRLEIGNLTEKLAEVAAEDSCDRVVMGSYGVAGMPRLDPVGGETEPSHLGLPVVVVLPNGEAVSA
jgi:nucleotide-binding universal stress UspA family protein